MELTADEVERMKLYGPCSVHGLPLDTRRTETGSSMSLETFCLACDGSEPWPLDVLLRDG